MQAEKAVAKLGVPVLVGRRDLVLRHVGIRHDESSQGPAAVERRHPGRRGHAPVEIAFADRENLVVDRVFWRIHRPAVTDEALEILLYAIKKGKDQSR